MTWRKSINKGLLHPGLIAVIEEALKILAGNCNPYKVYSGLRTFAHQDKLYAQGRTTGKKGAIVTKAKGGQSMHNYGLAVDMAPFNLITEDPNDLWWPDPDGRHSKIWFDLEEALDMAVRADPSEGIDYEWGGRWKFRDVPHVQVRTTFRELMAGHYPYCSDVEWLVKAHTTFLFGTPWMKRRIQYLLNMQSYSVGGVDGVWGERTSNAMMMFRDDQELKSTGNASVDIRLPIERLVRLHQEARSMERGHMPEALCE